MVLECNTTEVNTPHMNGPPMPNKPPRNNARRIDPSGWQLGGDVAGPVAGIGTGVVRVEMCAVDKQSDDEAHAGGGNHDLLAEHHARMPQHFETTVTTRRAVLRGADTQRLKMCCAFSLPIFARSLWLSNELSNHSTASAMLS
ncbi:MAG: hypothetical protein QOG79_3501 [Mycobacterium sp.]|nr:hypothetical protein [Mycobacterium sp.]